MSELPGAAFIFIDPQEAFTDPNGTLAKVYGKAELKPIEAALEKLIEFASQISSAIHVYFVSSVYAPGQFTSNDLSHPYAYVCTKENAIDCEWSVPSELLISRPVFSKKVQSAYSVPELRQILKQDELSDIFLSGFLFTSCVAESALEMRANISKDIGITIIEDTCGARLSKFQVCNGESEYSKVKKKLINAGVRFCMSGELK